MDFTAYFAAAAGASAALMGLLFVALQFNLEKRRNDLSWRPVARGTFNIFTVLFIISLFELIPFPDPFQSTQILIVASSATGIYRQLRIWYEARSYFKRDRLWHTLWLLIIPIMLEVLLILDALKPPGDPPKLSDILLASTVILTVMFLTALRNSWDLVFEAGLVESRDD